MPDKDGFGEIVTVKDIDVLKKITEGNEAQMTDDFDERIQSVLFKSVYGKQNLIVIGEMLLHYYHHKTITFRIKELRHQFLKNLNGKSPNPYRQFYRLINVLVKLGVVKVEKHRLVIIERELMRRILNNIKWGMRDKNVT
ncbi:hypothetical protein MUP79_03415 [Candidatus Bathyarchaeota archaeon]|nr:hypothetical protein [Candidatus Bathyarchaeota archaeon]